MTPHMQDELITACEVAVVLLAAAVLIVAAFVVGTWTV